jgi:DNA-binding CsgD family transcriptional regulator
MAALAPDAIHGEFVRLAQAGLGFHEYARAGMRVLHRAVAFDAAAAVWFDPTAALPVDKWIDGSMIDDAGLHLGEIDLDAADIDKFRELAASGRRAARLSEATEGKPDGGRGRREPPRPRGVGDELRVVRLSDSGLWGGMVLYRRQGAPHFTARDVNVLASLAGECAEAQRVRLEQDLSADGGDGDRGLLVLDDDDGIEMADAAAAAWLDELRATGGRLPLVVTAVAERARAIESGRADAAATATVRARARSGRWVVVRGSALGNGGRVPRIAVTLEPARAPELAEVIADAYGLTARERRVTELVGRGLPTAAIAAQLYLSTYTVQDHLKAIFEKLDVSSRGQLVARLFIDHSLGRGRHPSPPATAAQRA